MNKPTGDFTVYNSVDVLCSVCGQPKPHTTWNISIDPTQQLDLERINAPYTISRPSEDERRERDSGRAQQS
jgi:hypothetical protein